jgi:hypothetical protein
VVIGQTAKPVQQDDIHNNFNAIIEVLLDHPDVGKRSPIKKINETSGRAENISKYNIRTRSKSEFFQRKEIQAKHRTIIMNFVG